MLVVAMCDDPRPDGDRRPRRIRGTDAEATADVARSRPVADRRDLHWTALPGRAAVGGLAPDWRHEPGVARGGCRAGDLLVPELRDRLPLLLSGALTP